MNTLVALTSTTSIYAFRQRSLWMRPGYAALFVSCATPASGHSRLLAPHNYSAPTLEPVQSCFSKRLVTPTHSLESLFCCCSSPSLTVLFPCA
jgi:hypothetical protein